jgi:hypothetical protein
VYDSIAGKVLAQPLHIPFEDGISVGIQVGINRLWKVYDFEAALSVQYIVGR